MQSFLKHIRKLNKIHYQELSCQEPFAELAARFAQYTGTVVLMSGGEHDCARYNILAARPWLVFRHYGRQGFVQSKNGSQMISGDPLGCLQQMLDFFQLPAHAVQDELPVQAGLFGYLAYDLKNYIETLPQTCINDTRLPLVCLYAPSLIILQEIETGKYHLLIPGSNYSQANIQKETHFLQQALAGKPEKSIMAKSSSPEFYSNFSKKSYMQAVEEICEYIAAGDVYQVNLSQRMQADFHGNPFTLFLKLFQENPAPFYAYINAGDHHIVSTSPERFLLRLGQWVETRPIKGTRPRGKNKKEDLLQAKELQASAKDDSELSMIVDLLRNDLGKVCLPGSVQVNAHKRLEKYQNVFHLVSIIQGKLDPQYGNIDLLKAAFPGGSITGCPKVRAMEIIDQLEPNTRHIYTGSIGYLSFHSSLDLSIAIRTATIYNQKIIFSVGGGVVYDSNPEEEYAETLHKGRTLMQIFQREELPAKNSKTKLWLNGVLVEEDQARIPLTDPAVMYGFGFFETIRVDHGQPWFLQEHIQRFEHTWWELIGYAPPEISWEEIILEVIQANGLQEQTAAVKILASKGQREKPPYAEQLAVLARPYRHRLKGKKCSGLYLMTYPHSRHTPLAGHKTTNYLYYHLAGKWAQKQGADEALILNPDGSISETNSANILLLIQDQVHLPLSEHVLPGITLDKTCEILSSLGFKLQKRKIYSQDLIQANQVLLTNSLMGAVNVLGLDGKDLQILPGFCRKINKHLFSAGLKLA